MAICAGCVCEAGTILSAFSSHAEDIAVVYLLCHAAAFFSELRLFLPFPHVVEAFEIATVVSLGICDVGTLDRFLSLFCIRYFLGQGI